MGNLVESFSGIQDELVDFTLAAATLTAQPWTTDEQELNHTDIGNEENSEQPAQGRGWSTVARNNDDGDDTNNKVNR